MSPEIDRSGMGYVNDLQYKSIENQQNDTATAAKSHDKNHDSKVRKVVRAEVLDQQQTNYGTGQQWSMDGGGLWAALVAQTFTPTVAGYIPRLQFYVKEYIGSGTVYIYITAVDGDGIPTGAAIDSINFNPGNFPHPEGWYEATFARTGYTLTPGTQYAILLENRSSGPVNLPVYASNSNDIYAGGQFLVATPIGHPTFPFIWSTPKNEGTLNFNHVDMAFKIWMNVETTANTPFLDEAKFLDDATVDSNKKLKFRSTDDTDELTMEYQGTSDGGFLVLNKFYGFDTDQGIEMYPYRNDPALYSNIYFSLQRGISLINNVPDSQTNISGDTITLEGTPGLSGKYIQISQSLNVISMGGPVRVFGEIVVDGITDYGNLSVSGILTAPNIAHTYSGATTPPPIGQNPVYGTTDIAYVGDIYVDTNLKKLWFCTAGTVVPDRWGNTDPVSAEWTQCTA